MKTNLTDLYIKNINKAGRYTDSETKGLNLQVKPSLQKYWAFRFLFEEKRYDLSFGTYPEISLKEARKRAIEARNKLNQGISPKRAKAPVLDLNKPIAVLPTFKEYALACHELKRMEWKNKKHVDQWINTLRDYAFKEIGELSINEVDTEHILKILEPIWTTKTETASRLRARIEWVLASATTRKFRSGLNPALWRGHLETILQKPSKVSPVKHHKALPYRQLPEFMKQLREQDGLSALALEFLILNANRTSEVLLAKWQEIDEGLWVIPAQRMKSKKEHRVPLCKRSIEILVVARAITEGRTYIFSKREKPMSNMSLSAVLKRMSIDATVHGFRSVFRDWVAEETDFSPEVAEMALAHTIANKVEAAYRRGDLLERRKRLMEAWADYCESIPTNNIVSLKAA